MSKKPTLKIIPNYIVYIDGYHDGLYARPSAADLYHRSQRDVYNEGFIKGHMHGLRLEALAALAGHKEPFEAGAQ